ncbi:MAG: peptidoglycan-associated lipoprotein Pal [Nitrospinota bacterium]|nr:MAG: peptidoglycan-associated lipoprotein Pal [Nitrospinota bacterium]
MLFLLLLGCAKRAVHFVPPPESEGNPALASTPLPSPVPSSQEEGRGLPEEEVAEERLLSEQIAQGFAQPIPLVTGTQGTEGGPDASPLQKVYFEFDKATLTEEAKRTLQENAAWLRQHPEVKVQIEGHCDERGTIEYNLALGDRRAQAVKEYLVSLGIAPTRLVTVSYGEERPVDPGHNETAWAKNRRAEFKVLQRVSRR